MFVHKLRSRAFTLVEMLTVMAVISTLMAILLPAVNHVREVGRRTMCASNMRQFALAANVYHSIHSAFPSGQVGCPDPPSGFLGTFPQLMFRPGDDCVGASWLSVLLVHLDEKGLSDELVKCVGARGKKNSLQDCDKVINAPVPPYFICPSAPSDISVYIGKDTDSTILSNNIYKIASAPTNKGNYAGCWGMDSYYNLQVAPPPLGKVNGVYPAQADGVFGYVYVQKLLDVNNQPKITDGLFKMGHGKGTRIDYMGDGVSKTMMISEVVNLDQAADSRGAWFWGAMGNSAFSAKNPPNFSGGDQIPSCGTPLTRYDQWLQCKGTGGQPTDFATARSGHPGGVNIAMCDSSTRFMQDSVDPNVWKAASTKSGDGSKELSYPLPPAF